MTADILKVLIAMNLAAGGAIVIMLIAAKPLRRAFGARLAYAAWAVVPIAAVAALLPARVVERLPIAPGPAPLAEGAVQVLIVGRGAAFDWPSAAVLAWAIGAVGLIALTVWTQKRTLGLIGRLTREGPLVRSANRSVGPAILGIWRPRIMVPADFESRFDASEQAVIMAHEEAHIATGDARINALVELVRCLFWFNPLVHIAAQRIRSDQELACDEAVIARFPKARRTYAEALLKTQTTSAPLPLGCYWPQRSHQALKERLTMLTLKTPGRVRKLAGAACLAALGIGTGYAAWAAVPAAPLPEPVAAALAAAEPAPAPVPAPAPRPAPQTLTNAAPQPPAPSAPPTPPTPPQLEDHFVLFHAPLPEAIARPNGQRRTVFIARGDAPQDVGLLFSPDLARATVRIECRKVDDGALACTRNGQAVGGEELEKLKASLPPIPQPPPAGAVGETRTMILRNGRRPAE